MLWGLLRCWLPALCRRVLEAMAAPHRTDAHARRERHRRAGLVKTLTSLALTSLVPALLLPWLLQADTIQHIYSLLGVQPNGRMQFASEGWRGSCPVMLVSYIPARVEPAAAQQAAERATAAQTTAAPASAQAGMTPPAQSAAWAGGAPNAAAQPAAAGEAAEHASLLTPTSSLERAPSSALRQEEEAQSRPAGEQQCRQQQAQQPQLHVQQPRAQAQMQSPPQPQQERGQQQPQPSPQVAGPAMSAATPQRGTAGSNLADLAAAAEAAAVGQPAAAAGNPLPASNIAAAARTGWLSGEQVLELLSRPQEHGLRIVDFLKAKPGGRPGSPGQGNTWGNS